MTEEREELAITLQKAIERVRGVVSASVSLEQDGSIAEIHATVSTERRPKQIVRDIETLLATHFRIKVDYRRVSLAQLEPEEADSIRNRLRFVGARTLPDRPGQVLVELRMDELTHAVVQKASSEESVDYARAAVMATLAAIQQALPVRVNLSMDGVRLVDLEGGQVCVAVVSAISQHGAERLTGTCLLGSDICVCASKAALDAVNRRLPIWIQPMSS